MIYQIIINIVSICKKKSKNAVNLLKIGIKRFHWSKKSATLKEKYAKGMIEKKKYFHKFMSSIFLCEENVSILKIQITLIFHSDS